MDTRRTFIRQIGLGTAGALVMPSTKVIAGVLPASGSLPRSTPEMQGVSSAVLNNLFDAMDASDIEFHSVMVVRNGFVIAEGWWAPYAPQYRHTLHSLSKSFTSAAVGLAISEGHFTVETPVISFFPDMLPKVISPNLAAMKVKHLLTMTTGHQEDKGLMTKDAPWVQTFLAAPIVHEPGTFYVYNTTASYMLSAIVQKTTGKTVLEYLTSRLLRPLDITGADWEVSPQGINTGGFGLRIRTEDIAKFSQLYLNKGKWKGKQLIPENWVEASGKEQWTFTSNPFGGKTPKANDDWQQGYGYQFWRTQHNGFRSDGLYGQFGIILPDEQTVVAITEQSFNTQKTLNFVWDILLPGLQKTKLPANYAANQKLKTTEEALQVKFAPLFTTSPLAKSISGKKFIFDSNTLGARSITFNFNNNTCEVLVDYEQGTRKLTFGLNKWEKGKNGIMLNEQLLFPVGGLPNVASPVAGNATWNNDNTLYLAIRPVETVTGDSITCAFADNKVTLSFMHSVAKAGKAKEQRPVITGIMD
ncbi:MAG: serine hydrolase domain-containing protein [Mucilaginibacter sp.]